jgi:hypothetical protein
MVKEKKKTVSDRDQKSMVSDQPATEDRLGFSLQVQAIADFLTSPETAPPLTMSIEGQWGSGKSSFMLQLEALLKEKNATVRFNPWRYDKEEMLWATFALQFINQLSDNLDPISRLKAHTKLLFKRFDWSKGRFELIRVLIVWTALVLVTVALPIVGSMWGYEKIQQFLPVATGGDWLAAFVKIIGGAGGIGTTILILLPLWRKLKAFLGNPIKTDLKKYIDSPGYEERIPFIERFQEDLRNILDSYVGEDKRVFIFIDDLDRCNVPKSAELMQGLNLMMPTDSRLIFILGMDREKVAAGLAVKYEKLLPYIASFTDSYNDRKNKEESKFISGLRYGNNFIEKFVQVPFSIPKPDEVDLLRLIEGISEQKPVQRGKAEFILTSEKIKEIAEMVVPALRNNPRRFKQFLNIFRLRAYITWWMDLLSDDVEGLTIEKLGKYIAIQVRWPTLIQNLERDRQLLAKLHTLALGEETLSPDDLTDAMTYWSEDHDLINLIRYGLHDIEQGDAQPTKSNSFERYNLAKLNIDTLRLISPRIPQPQEMAEASMEEKEIDYAQESISESFQPGPKMDTLKAKPPRFHIVEQMAKAPTVVNAFDGVHPPSVEPVQIIVEDKSVFCIRLDRQKKEHVGKVFRKGLYRIGPHKVSDSISIHLTNLKEQNLTDSEINVIFANSENFGNFDAVNTWDNQFLSFGIIQWTAGGAGEPGELPALLKCISDSFPDIFQHYWGQFGLNVIDTNATSGWFNYQDRKLISAMDKEMLRDHIWAYRFAIAGSDTKVQVMQLLFTINRLKQFYFRKSQNLAGYALSDLITSEFGVALLLDNHVNRPGYVTGCVAEAIKRSNFEYNEFANGGNDMEDTTLQNYISVRETYGKYPMTDAIRRADATRRYLDDGTISAEKGSFLTNLKD